ncbi:MAG: hypothetical protein AB1689_25010 [Thermodesulfobacteriota bacterium]
MRMTGARSSEVTGSIAPAGSRTLLALHALAACVAGCVAAACGPSDDPAPTVGAPAPIAMTVVNQVPIPAPCMGASLTFFEGTTPVDVPYQSQKTVQVAQLFGVYQIGFQVNGWYWRSCTSPGDCPNPRNCQNPDNAGQVAVEIAADCSTATLVQNFSAFTCDAMVPNASQAVTITLQSASPCTVVVAPTSSVLTPTDQCCSCASCSGSQIPAGQVPHCQ